MLIQNNYPRREICSTNIFKRSKTKRKPDESSANAENWNNNFKTYENFITLLDDTRIVKILQ